MHVWKEGSLMIEEMEIGAAIFVAILVLGLCVITYKKWDLHKARSDYDSFLLLNETNHKDEKM